MSDPPATAALDAQAQHALLDGLRREDNLGQLERAV